MSDRAPDAVALESVLGRLATRALGVVADLRIPDALASGPREMACSMAARLLGVVRGPCVDQLGQKRRIAASHHVQGCQRS